MTNCKGKSLLRKNMNEYLHQKGCRNPCTIIIAQQSILFIRDWTIYKSTFYGISFPASPSLKGHSTHMVVCALPSIHFCTREVSLDLSLVPVLISCRKSEQCYMFWKFCTWSEYCRLNNESKVKVNGNLHSNLAKILLEHIFKELNLWWLHQMSHWM